MKDPRDMSEDEVHEFFAGLRREYPPGRFPTAQEISEEIQMATHHGDYLVVVLAADGEHLYGMGPLSRMDAVRVADQERRELDADDSKDHRIVLVPHMGDGLDDE